MATTADIRDQISRSLDTDADSFDVDAIADELIEKYDPEHIDEIPSSSYWETVRRHERNQF